MFPIVYSQAITAGADNGVVSGVFIPINNLQGITAEELASDQTDILREGKIIYGLVNQLFARLTALSPLGIVNVEKSIPSGTGTNRFTESVSFITQFVQDYSTRTFYRVPLPPSAVGKASIADIFPNASLVTAEGAISGAGIVFSHSLANTYGAVTPSSVTVDARDWIFSIMHAAIAESTLRTSSVASAITNRTNLLNNRVAGLAIPTAYYDTTSPTSGILAANTPHLRLIQETLSIEYEIENFPLNQTQEVRVSIIERS